MKHRIQPSDLLILIKANEERLYYSSNPFQFNKTIELKEYPLNENYINGFFVSYYGKRIKFRLSEFFGHESFSVEKV